jgi:hypothetical protein
MTRKDAIPTRSIHRAFRSMITFSRVGPRKRRMKFSTLIPALLLITALTAISLPLSRADSGKHSFDPGAWSVRCWNGETRRWEDLGIGKMAIAKGTGATRITNTSGIHRHAHLVHAVSGGDFTFTIELRGGYELGFLNAEGKDEMLYVELPKKHGDEVAEIPLDEQTFHTYEISRQGTRFTIRRDGRPVPMVHFQFDYGEAFVIMLAVKDGESVDVKAVR